MTTLVFLYYTFKSYETDNELDNPPGPPSQGKKMLPSAEKRFSATRSLMSFDASGSNYLKVKKNG